MRYKTIEEVQKDINENLKAFETVVNCIGYYEISETGKQKINALKEISNNTDFSETIDDLVKILLERKEELVKLQIFDFIVKWIKHNVGIEIHE